MATLSDHFVLSSTPMWSHFRALCILSSKIVVERPVIVTLIVPNWGTTFEKATAEVARCLSAEGSQKGVVRVVALGPRSANPADACMVYAETFEPVWTSLINEQSIKCANTGTEFPAASKPTFVMLDGFEYPWLSIIRATAPGVPVLCWMIGFSGGLLRGCLPNSQGGIGDTLRVPFTPEEALNNREFPQTGDIVRIKSMPDMHDWEHFPQAMHVAGMLQLHESNYARFMMECDGLATTCTFGYDGEALDVTNAWLLETGRPTFHLGPMMPLEPGTTNFTPLSMKGERDAAPPGVGARVTRFLEGAVAKYGEHSVVYICFGNFFWPLNPDHLWLFIDTLANQGIPFLLSTASPMAQVPDHIKARFEDSDIGYLAPWAPQQYILSHEAVGWFLSHCGGQGSMESLTQGVPILAWPFFADQPINAAYLTHKLDVAIEFYEVRTGELGLKHAHLADKTPVGTIEAFQEELEQVMADMKGEVGARKRANAKKQQAIIRTAWNKDGSARLAFEDFLRRYAH